MRGHSLFCSYTLTRYVVWAEAICPVWKLPNIGIMKDAPDHKNPRLTEQESLTVLSFFHNRAAFDAIERDVVPRLFEGKSARDTVRVWVAGCATGEEAYSVAMLLLDHAASLPQPPEVQV